jgi:hypothetical protein
MSKENCHPACPGVPRGVSWEQPACLWQVKKEKTLQNRHRCEARRAGRKNVSPARKGWGSIPKMSRAP